MLSIVIPCRNAREMVHRTIGSTRESVHRLGLAGVTELILIDDASDAELDMPALFREAKTGMGFACTAVRFKARQHYSKAVALGMSLAKGENVVLVSHDMVVTPAYLRGLLAGAALDPTHGIVRGSSNYVDCFPQYVVPSPFLGEAREALFDYAEVIARILGLAVSYDELLTGDSMLVRREVIEKVGVFDTKYPGYYGDIDYGLRVQRAGFKLACVRGAWLFHEGAGHYTDQARRTGASAEQVQIKRMETVNAAYKVFREKWDRSMPANYMGGQFLQLPKLLKVSMEQVRNFEPKVELDGEVAEVL